ncbi:hypothetical protein CDAR_230601 [Caerostris darwini]|uniref:Uncharacterized protein n=1 Tax=Caerostris darwini TaxID=1538125 RepID=A0AAV4SLA4_9ARAC|nr:hypothetical protein CDAR_230601 [Caerostris darwini]
MGADTHIPQRTRTSLHEAYLLDEIECAEMLLKYETNNWKFPGVKLLLKEGVDEYALMYGRIPVHEACWLDCENCVELLLADVFIAYC